MKKVYLINLSYGIAGTEKRFLNIWKELKSRGNVIPKLVIPDTLATLFYQAGMLNISDPDLVLVPENKWVRELCKPRFKHSLLNDIVTIIRSRFMAFGYRTIWDIIRKDKSKVIIHMGMKCSALFPPNFPIVYECVDSTLSEFRRGHFLRASKKRSIVNCQTDRILSAVEQAYKGEKTNWKLYTSPSYFGSYQDSTNFPYSKDNSLIVFAGRMAPEKNPEIFVEALSLLHNKGLNFKAVILGEGPLFQKVKNRIAELDLSDKIEIMFSKNPEQYFDRASIFVSLQSGDNYGSQSLVEAMSAGCAVIASDVGETHRIINDTNGLLVRLDKSDLANAISQLLENPIRMEALGRNAMQLVRTRYTASFYAAYLEKLYESADLYFQNK